MIWESHPWKAEIKKSARYFERLHSQPRPLTEFQMFCVEKHVFLSFYAIRKLIEAEKISDTCESKQVPVTIYPRTSKPITRFNWHKIDELFDFDKPTQANLSVQNLCNQFIHSYIFHVMIEGVGQGNFAGVLVASDRQKGKGLIGIYIKPIIALFETIVQDDVVCLHWMRNPKTEVETVAKYSYIPQPKKKP